MSQPLYSIPGSPMYAAPVGAVLTPAFTSGNAAQLADMTRAYEVYFQLAGGAGTVTLAIGPTSTPAYTIASSAVTFTGEVLRVRLPAGWYLEITLGTSTIASQIAIGC